MEFKKIKYRNVTWANRFLARAAEVALSHGIKVFVRGSDKYRWMYFENDKGDVGTCQDSGYTGVNFSTLNMPGKSCGTGFRMNEHPVIEPSIDHIKSTFTFCPHWAEYKQRSEIVKYKGMEQYTKNNPHIIPTDEYFEIVNGISRKPVALIERTLADRLEGLMGSEEVEIHVCTDNGKEFYFYEGDPKYMLKHYKHHAITYLDEDTDIDVILDEVCTEIENSMIERDGEED